MRPRKSNRRDREIRNEHTVPSFARNKKPRICGFGTSTCSEERGNSTRLVQLKAKSTFLAMAEGCLDNSNLCSMVNSERLLVRIGRETNFPRSHPHENEVLNLPPDPTTRRHGMPECRRRGLNGPLWNARGGVGAKADVTETVLNPKVVAFYKLPIIGDGATLSIRQKIAFPNRIVVGRRGENLSSTRS
jgi:hypothetical protein